MNRRQFIQASSVALGAALFPRYAFAQKTTVKIERVELFPLRYPMTGYFKFFSGAKGADGRAAVIIKLTASDGTVGWGQSVPIPRWSYETLETSVTVLQDYFAPELLGKNPLDIDGTLDALDKVIAPAFSTGMPITRAGIDIALHDLAGKLQGKSLAELWGKSAGEKLLLSWTVNVTSLDDVEKVMAEGRSRGYKNFNIKVSPDPKFDIELARAVRRLEPEGFLWADANGGYDPATALAAAPKLADAGVNVLEAPIRPNQISGYQALKKQGALPILMDEGVVSPVELKEFIKLGMLDGMAMKPSRCGGLLSNKRQIELCEKHDLIWLGSGLTDPDISFAATLMLYSAYDLKKPAALNGPQFLTEQVLKTPIKVQDGFAYVPQGPGLGIDVDEEKVIELMKSVGGDKLLKGEV